MTRVELLNSFHSKILKIADIITEEEMTAFLELKEQALAQEPMLDKLRAEIAEYDSIWVEYKITGRRDKDIEQLVSDVLSRAKKQVLEVIDKYKGESEVK